jgi:branched-chain amino acid transport system ATP-binding protein
MMLDVTDLHSYYEDSYILQGISFEVPKGNVIAVLGRNGVGKTTLINSIVALVKPRRGKILFEGQEITGKPTHEIIRQGMALVPQGRRVFYSLTVMENLTVPFRCLSSIGTKAKPWREEGILEIFPILRERCKQKAGTLSGGEQQMLAIARALVSSPKFLLLDEPSEGLAPLVVREIAKTIPQLRGQGITMLLVEQNFNMALSVADRIFVMSRGKMVHESSPENLSHNEEIKARYLGM